MTRGPCSGTVVRAGLAPGQLAHAGERLHLDTAPSGLTLYLDGIARTTPFVYDTLIGFVHSIEARNQSLGGVAYTFDSWSDGGAQTHNITVPSNDDSFTATYRVAIPATPTCLRVNSATPAPPSTVTYYAKSTDGRAPGPTRSRSSSTRRWPSPTFRILECGGLDRTNPLDVSQSAAGNANTANSGAATTNFTR